MVSRHHRSLDAAAGAAEKDIGFALLDLYLGHELGGNRLFS